MMGSETRGDYGQMTYVSKVYWRINVSSGLCEIYNFGGPDYLALPSIIPAR